MRIPTPIVTREHGSWAVLFVPIAVAAGIAEQWTLEMILLTIAALAAFLSYVPAQIILREKFGTRQDPAKLDAARIWFAVYGIVGCLALLPLFLRGYWLLFPLGVSAVLCFGVNFFLTRVRAKTVLSDLVAVVGLTTGAPAVLYVAKGELSGTAFLVWFLNVLFFGSSVVYVHMKIAATSLKHGPVPLTQRLSVGFLNVVYHIVVFGIVVLLVVFEYTPTLVLVAFVPITIHALYGTYTLSPRVHFKRLGFLLVGHALLFAFIVGMASRL